MVAARKAAHVGLAAKEYVPVPAYGREGEGPGWATVEGLDGALIDRVFEERKIAIGELPWDRPAPTFGPGHGTARSDRATCRGWPTAQTTRRPGRTEG